jgi:hypothetical protein
MGIARVLPTAAQAFALSERFGLHGPKALAAFHGSAHVKADVTLSSRAGVAALLRGTRRCNVDRGTRTALRVQPLFGFALGQRQSRATVVRVLELGRSRELSLLDFLSQFADLAKVPWVADDWRAKFARCF